MTEKLVRWSIFGLVIALLPILFNLIHLFTRRSPVTLELLTGRGELLLVASGISARGIGELLGSGPPMKIRKLVVGGLAVIVLLSSSFSFADVAAGYGAAQPVDATTVAVTSTVLFVFAAISGGFCVALGEVR